eukprot:3152223-Pyramimonas_sp.AAC.1
MLYVLANVRKVKTFIPKAILPTNAESSGDEKGDAPDDTSAHAASSHGTLSADTFEFGTVGPMSRGPSPS